ncbi:hypothetical protein [Burkholderia ubonensis]|uniref:hypothetical protein n=1 Tax=Burkholderia ubonensis TaxID=101571 RepID=UPI0011607C05|nr:hypothetical protein [Burkholderia ubonensis]
MSEQDVANAIVASPSGTSQVTPTYWLNPRDGASHPILAQILGGLATIKRSFDKIVRRKLTSPHDSDNHRLQLSKLSFYFHLSLLLLEGCV